MAKVYFFVDAEFEQKFGNATDVAHGINNGNLSVNLTLDQVDAPLTHIAFEINQSCKVEGELSAAVRGKTILIIKMKGIFCLEVKPVYMSWVLDENTLWVVYATKITKGLRLIKYEDYYGPKEKYVLEQVVAKSRKEIQGLMSKAKMIAMPHTEASADVPQQPSIVIEGVFNYFMMSEVTGKKIKSIRKALEKNTLDAGELLQSIQQSPGYFSLYGSEIGSSTVELDGQFCFSTSELSKKKLCTQASQLSGPPVETYLKNSIDLQSFPKDISYLIIIAACNGKEERRIPGQFNKENMTVRRVSIKNGPKEDFMSVVQVDYLGAEIEDHTDSELAAIFSLENGVIERLD